MAWYVVAEGSDPVGPVEDDLIERGILSGKIPLDAMICGVGETEWKSLASVKLFAEAMRAVAPPPPSPGRTNPPPRQRSEHTLSDVFPLATSAPPYIPGPAPLPSFDDRPRQNRSAPRQAAPVFYAHENPPAPFGHAVDPGGPRNSPTTPPAALHSPSQQLPPDIHMLPFGQPLQPSGPQPASLPQVLEQPGFPSPAGAQGAFPPPRQAQPTLPPSGLLAGNINLPPSAYAQYLPGADFGTPRGPLLAAIILTSIAAVFWFAVILVRIIIFVRLQKGDIDWTAVSNIVGVGLDFFVVAALYGRKRAGYSWGLVSHGFNALLGLYQLFGASPYLILVVPVHAFAAATIWSARHELIKPMLTPAPRSPAAGQPNVASTTPPANAPNPLSTAKLAAQRLADVDTTRVLLGIAGVVAIAVSILFLIFLARQE